MEGGRESRDYKRNDVEVEVKIVKPLFDHDARCLENDAPLILFTANINT